jgi:HPt (histidine-containing phosphotransfer) domain-containing protein
MNATASRMPPVIDAASPPLDFSRLHMVAETAAEQADILNLFFRLARDIVQQMTYARRNEECTPWQCAAHSLKGSAANLGMARLERACFEAEHAIPPVYVYNDRTELLNKVKAELLHLHQFLRHQHTHIILDEVSL